MTVESREALASLQDIAQVEKRTREAMFYSGCSSIFILWGVLVACGYGLTFWHPGWARTGWLAISILGCAATALIVAMRLRARPREARDWRIIAAMVTLMVYGAGWSWALGPIIPHRLIYAFQPSLVMLGMVLAGLWIGRFFAALGLVGLALILVGETQREPWLQLWMAVAQSGTLIVGGLWLRRIGIAR